jgi:UDP-glucose 4-epimerase
MRNLCVVTGGAGFIGSHLVKKLLEGGRRVRVVDNFFTGRRENVPKEAELVEGDVNDVVHGAVKGADTVFHLAAIPWVQYAIEHPKEAWHANAESTLSTLKAAEVQGVRRFVFVSSCAVYGEGRSMRPASAYGEAKLRGEDYCNYWYKSSPLETVVLRFFNVYSDLETSDSVYSRVIPLFARQALSGKPITINGDGLQTRDFIHVNDVVRALLSAADAKVSGQSIDVATGTPVSILDLGKMVAKAAGVAPCFKHKPALTGETRFVEAHLQGMRESLRVANLLPLEEGVGRVVKASTRLNA